MITADLIRVVASLYAGESLTTQILRERYGLKESASKRTLAELVENLPVEVEYGKRGERTIRLRTSEPEPTPEPKRSGRPATPTTWMQH